MSRFEGQSVSSPSSEKFPLRRHQLNSNSRGLLHYNLKSLYFSVPNIKKVGQGGIRQAKIESYDTVAVRST